MYVLLLAAALLIWAGMGSSCVKSESPGGDDISIQEKISIGNLPQQVVIRGRDINLPVLLILHGGPGFSEMALFNSYNSELQKHFIIAQYDQRGTNLSFSPNIPPESMNVNQFVADAHEMVNYLKQRFHKQKIYLLGHSWGTVLGVRLVQQYPEDFHAFVSVSQMVHIIENERLSFRFTLEEAEKDSNQEAITQLKAIESGYLDEDGPNLQELQVQRRWLLYYGGAVYGQRDYSQLFAGIKPRERHLLVDSLAAAGEPFSIISLWPDLLQVNFLEKMPRLEVPVHFLVGRHDYNTPAVLTEQYYQLLQAPYKTLTWFEESAHMVPFEEPEKFNAVLVNKLLP
jgi:pimeloyl-ACP methyl ester carboxylesterase